MSEGVSGNDEASTETTMGGAGSKLSQQTYSPTGFNQSNWEVVGEFAGEYSFEPIDIEVLSSETHIVDPMFADYGSGQAANAVRRWSANIKLPVEEEVVQPQISLEEMDKKIQEAEQRGREQALQEAKLLREQELEKVSDNLVNSIKDIEFKANEKFIELEKAALHLAVEISRKIIEQAVEINPEYIVDLIKQALGLSGSATIKKVKVSPQDMEFIEVMGVARKLKEHDGTWQFEGDEAIKSGCIVETSAGEVDFQLDKAWQRIAETVVRPSK